MTKKSSSSGSTLSVQTIVLAATAWAVMALLFFLLFSVPLPGQGRPGWYNIITYVFENVAFLGATLLCFRNWTSSQIVSGRNVWLAIGLGMMSFFIGNLLLAYWEIALGQSPDVSPGDLFFILTYLLLGWGMLQAVVSRRLNLTTLQYGIVVMIALAGIAFAYFLYYSAPEDLETAIEAPPAIEQLAEGEAAIPPGEAAPPVSPDSEAAAAEVPATEVDESAPAPGWAIALEGMLSPYADIVALLYIVGDIVLVIMATTLLLAFWGGRFSLSWRFIAAAAFSFYIADMWFGYAVSFIDDYQTGALPEVFWIFSGALFGIGAALEYDLSTRSRRTGRRRA